MGLWRQGHVRAVERVHDAVEADALVLAHLVELGCDPRTLRECRHYLYVPSELGARSVASSLNSADDWDAEVEEVRDAWLVTATTFTGLDNDVVRGTRARFERLARDHGGEYDGWEAAAD
jgi:Regulator of ribonuclease activity B